MRGSASLLCIVFFAIVQTAFGQDGLPFMTEVELSRQYSDSRIGSIIQESEEAMFFSTSRGVLRYDGATWERIATPSPVLRIFQHELSNRTFVGLKSGAMEIIRSDSGTYEVRSIQGLNSKQPIQHIIATDNDIYFVGESEIHQYSPLQKENAKTYVFAEKLISGAFISNSKLYILFFQEGLFEWQDGKLNPIGDYTRVAEDQMLFSFEASVGTYVGFDSDVIYRFSDGVFHAVKEHLRKYVSDNFLSDGLLLNDSLMAISTLAGGAIVANINTNDIKYRFDYTTGARDNEIFCLGKDRDEGLWMAYEAGLSRVDLAQPVKNFSGYPGLEGNLTASLFVNGHLHVGTGNGVFVLKQATSQAEIERMMEEMMRKKQEAKEDQASNYVPPESQVSNTEEKEAAELIERFKENPSEVKEELSRKEIRELKREIRKQRREERKNMTPGEIIEDIFTNGSDSEPEPKKQSGPDPMRSLIPNPTTGPAGSGMTAPPGSAGGQRNKPQVLQQESQAKKVAAQEQKLKTLRNSYLFKKVKGIDVKCRQLISIQDQVFAATNNGLYHITGESSSNLAPGMYINYVTASADEKRLLIASLNGVYELKQNEGGKWVSHALNDSVRFVAYNVIEDTEGSVWAGTDNGAYHYLPNETKLVKLPDVLNERVLVTNAYGKIHFLLPSALFHYVSDADTVLPATLPEIPQADRLEYLLGDHDIIWVRSNLGWHVLNGERFIPLLPYLELFEDIRNLSTDKDGNIYVIDKSSDIYSVENSNISSAYKFNIYIRQVVDANGQSFSLESTKIETDGNALVFNVSAPFYLKKEGTKYQFRIKGPYNNWSQWLEDPEIHPGIIPPGDYVLEVRARNILGEMSEIKTLAFKVPRPLYLRWYFLVLYVAILTLLIFTIIKIRERSLKETQRILEAKVAERTAELEEEKVKTEELLLNILPKDTADELQKNGKATARHYNQVSVLFTDFKGFTAFAEKTKPEDLVSELHRYFVKFDEIIGKYYLEKIKTIGDAYMCAGGVPIRNNSNAIAITLAALEIREYMKQVAAEKQSRNEEFLEIRIGIHTGPLTAGVVGMKKFAYDIWGDTVNTASRMESSSEPGRVNVSGTTHEMIKKYFDCEYRGKRDAKGKGAVDMYFVNAIKPEFSEGGDGMTPNGALLELIS
ncbi:MAG: hypothetical protein GC178_13265 [Flavobacteriales bacterium]|nr:hypothetical protein [Flavobacteriales bacterium]